MSKPSVSWKSLLGTFSLVGGLLVSIGMSACGEDIGEDRPAPPPGKGEPIGGNGGGIVDAGIDGMPGLIDADGLGIDAQKI